MIKRKNFIPNIKFNIPLKNHTTFKIGGSAKYFFKAKDKKDLIKAIKWAKDNNLPYFILGGGSNILVGDKRYEGMIIKCQMSNVKCQNHMSNVKTIFAEAGTKLENLVKLAMEKGLTGMEWAAGIPGTIGGAIRGNAAAFGHSISEIVQKVETLNDNFQSSIFNLQNCQFNYKSSIFKRNSNLIIVSAEIKLEKGDEKEIRKKIKAKDVLDLIKLIKNKVKSKFKINLQEEIQFVNCN